MPVEFKCYFSCNKVVEYINILVKYISITFQTFGNRSKLLNQKYFNLGFKCVYFNVIDRRHWSIAVKYKLRIFGIFFF